MQSVGISVDRPFGLESNVGPDSSIFLTAPHHHTTQPNIPLTSTSD